MATSKIALIGLESRDRALLETSIDLAGGLASSRWEITSDLETAQVILVNIDTPEGKDRLDATHSDPDQNNPLVIACSADSNLDSGSDLTLSLPISYKDATVFLRKLETKLAAPKKKKVVERIIPVVKATTKPTPEIEPEREEPKPILDLEVDKINPVDIAKHKIDWLSDDDDEVEASEFDPSEIDDVETDVTNPVLTEVTPPPEDVIDEEIVTVSNPITEKFDPDSRILGLILKVVDSGKTTLVSHPTFPELRIFPDNGWFVFAEDLESYPEMFRESADAFSVEVIDEEIQSELVNGRLPQSLWKLLFTAALFGSEGRLLQDLSRSKPFHLVHTPYFGMIPHTTDHITIAEYMVNTNEKLEMIQNETNVDIETIIDFCNACNAIQLLQNGDAGKPISKQFNYDPNNETDISNIENDTTLESEIIRESRVETQDKEKKSGFINSLWSNLTKT